MSVYLCNKHFKGNVDLFFEEGDKVFIKTIVLGTGIILLQLIYFPAILLLTKHF